MLQSQNGRQPFMVSPAGLYVTNCCQQWGGCDTVFLSSKAEFSNLKLSCLGAKLFVFLEGNTGSKSLCMPVYISETLHPLTETPSLSSLPWGTEWLCVGEIFCHPQEFTASAPEPSSQGEDSSALLDPVEI